MEKQICKDDGTVRLVKVPENRKPTVTSLKSMENEISSQIRANEAMRRSMYECQKARMVI